MAVLPMVETLSRQAGCCSAQHGGPAPCEQQESLSQFVSVPERLTATSRAATLLLRQVTIGLAH